MSTAPDYTFTILVSTLAIILFLGLAVMLFVVNNNRMIKHRAEIAEMRHTRDREVIEAEREATRQSLHDVGRELHDNIGQLLTAAQVGMVHSLEERPDAPLEGALNALEQGIEEVRRLGRTLNVDLWAQRSFPDALRMEAQRIERVCRTDVQVIERSPFPDLPPDVKTVLYRVFQEVMNNALKHARADLIIITLDGSPQARVTISDNGEGFYLTPTLSRGEGAALTPTLSRGEGAGRTKEAGAALTPTLSRGEGAGRIKGEGAGNGILNIRRRCELIGFRTELATAPGEGTTWTLTQA